MIALRMPIGNRVVTRAPAHLSRTDGATLARSACDGSGMTFTSGGLRAGGSSKPPGSARLVWLVMWEWVGDHARVEQPIAAMLPRRLGHTAVQRIVETLYAEREYSPAEMMEAARDRGHSPYRAHLGSSSVTREDGSLGTAEWQGEVICGHNPHLVARHARVWVDGDAVRYKWAHERPHLDLRGYRPRSAPLEPPG